MLDVTHDVRRTSAEVLVYERHHCHPANRALHAIGIPLIALSGSLLVPGQLLGWSRRTTMAAFAGGWALLLIGHAIEGNRPVILTNPRAIPAALSWWTRGAISRLGLHASKKP
jgi:uncharacterized membrane protein YGL010W